MYIYALDRNPKQFLFFRGVFWGAAAASWSAANADLKNDQWMQDHGYVNIPGTGYGKDADYMDPYSVMGIMGAPGGPFFLSGWNAFSSPERFLGFTPRD
jgi:hypothetical protein